MATITIDVPDEIARQFKIDPAALSALLREAMTAKRTKLQQVVLPNAPPIYREVLDFLATAPDAQQLANFKISDSAQQRLEDLLFKSREEELTVTEKTELELYLHLSHLLTRLKAHAHRTLAATN
jgi:phosphoglycolate phosphatase-like HAD superfamily hydrolase